MYSISKYVFENLEIGDEIKNKMNLIENLKLSYTQFKKYEYAKIKFIQGQINQNLSENAKNKIINQYIHEVLTEFNNIIKKNDELTNFYQFMANLADFNNNPTSEKAEQLQKNIQTIKETNLDEKQIEFLNEAEKINFNEIIKKIKQ